MKRSVTEKYSIQAIEWLEYLSSIYSTKILHAMNGGEVVIEDPELVTKNGKSKKYYVDGFCEETNTIYEYMGDFHHGNLNVNKSELFNRKYAATLDRENRLKELGFIVVTIWHSEWINSIERLEFIGF